MGLLDFILGKRPNTASVAKERLQIVLAHERAGRDAPDFLPVLQKELLAVVGKYLDVSEDMIRVNLQRRGEVSTLEINVDMDKARAKPPVKGPPLKVKQATAKGRL